MNKQDIINFIRKSVVITNPDGDSTEVDPAYLSLTDKEIEMFLQIALSRDFPQILSVDFMSNDLLYPVVLLTRKELYYTLATTWAKDFDLGADNNNYLKREQRFNHYMALIKQVDDEYKDYLENGGGESGQNVLTSFEVRIDSRSNTQRYLELSIPPKVAMLVDNVGETFVEVSWRSSVENFNKVEIYYSKEPIVDLYSKDFRINPKAKLFHTTLNPHTTKCRVEGLEENENYYIAIALQDRITGLKAYNQVRVIREVGDGGG